MTVSYPFEEELPQPHFPDVSPSIVRELGRHLSLRPSITNLRDVADVNREEVRSQQEIEESLSFIERAGRRLASIERSLSALKSQASDLQRTLEETAAERNLLAAKLEEAERALVAETERSEKANQLVKEHEIHSRRLTEQLRSADRKVSELNSAIASAFSGLDLQ